MARTNGAVAAAHRGIELLGYSFGHRRCEVEAEGRGAGRSRSSGRGGEIIEGPGCGGEGTLTIYIAYGECMLRQNISQTLPDTYVHSGMFSELQPKTSLNLCHSWTGIFCKQAQAALRHGKYSGRLLRVATKQTLFVLMVKGYFVPEFVV
uniref:Uncharacterized protein n=1 Tax=Oryza barthii TaxID=65489 RepID=A0A0D3FSS7_9ORYZ